MTRPVRLPTASSEVADLKRRVFDLERRVRSSQTDTRTDVDRSSVVEINEQSGTSYTLVLADAGKLVKMTSGSSNTVTIPPYSSVKFVTGQTLEIVQWGAGQTTIAEGSGVTTRSAADVSTIASQYGGVTLTKIGTNEWWLEGRLG